MNLGLEYIKYRWNAKGREALHSPFINDMIKNCLSIKLEAKDKDVINSLINSLRSSKETIEIEDFGAGSKRLGNIRPVASILKTSSSKGKYGDFLYQISKHYKFKKTLEFGTSLGIGSIHMALGNKNGKVTTVEACENTRALALKSFKKTSTNNVLSLHSTFNDYLKIAKKEEFDLIFVDGHHDGDALLDYMKELKDFSHSNTMFILDDIRWSNSMFDAWNKLKRSADYNISIDAFRFGILIPQSQEENKHFTIKL